MSIINTPLDPRQLGRVSLFLTAALVSAVLTSAQTPRSATERILKSPGRMEWIHDIQAMLGIGFGFPDAEVKLGLWMADCDFNFVDWCLPSHLTLSDYLWAHCGVGASGADYQWSEFWEFEYPKLGGAAPKVFVNDVICNTIDGRPAIDLDQGTVNRQRRFSACANRPRWQEFRTNRNLGLPPHSSAVT